MRCDADPLDTMLARVLKAVILTVYDPKTQVVRRISRKDSNLQATRDEGASEAIIFIPCSSFTVGEEVPLYLIYSTPSFLINKLILYAYDSFTFHKDVFFCCPKNSSRGENKNLII